MPNRLDGFMVYTAEQWTSMRFMSSGSNVIPRALVPVEICIKKDEGVYIEPNVWMEHRING